MIANLAVADSSQGRSRRRACPEEPPPPAGIAGHFGAEPRRFVLARYHRGQVTVPRLVAQLDDLGIAISKRQSPPPTRSGVTRRKISAGTRSDAGRDCRDGFLGLMKSRDKLDIGF